MACGECGKNEEEIYLPDEICPEDVTEDHIPYCTSNKGKFHDRILTNFVVPKVGGLADMYVCEAGLWAECQWVGICARGKYYFFKIVSVGEKIIRVLNGCSKGDSTQPISGNPEPGTEIPENTVIFPTPPQGCSDQLSARISSLIENYGCDSVRKCIEESEQLCFKNLKELEDSEEINLLGVTKDACECAPEGSILEKCLRWVGRIFTGYGGKTLCFPYATETSDNDVVVDDIPVSKRYAYFDEKGCIRKGKKVKDCGEASQLSPGEGEEFDYLLACKDGNRVTIPPSCEFDIASCCDKDGENAVFKFVKKSNKEYLLDPDDWQEFNPATPGTEDLTLEKVDDYKICGNYPKFAIVRVYGATVANSGNPGVSSLTAKLGDPLKEVFFGYSVLGSWSGGWAEHRVRLTDNGKLKLESSVYGSDAGRSLKIIVIGFVV